MNSNVTLHPVQYDVEPSTVESGKFQIVKLWVEYSSETNPAGYVIEKMICYHVTYPTLYVSEESARRQVRKIKIKNLKISELANKGSCFTGNRVG